MSFTPNDKKNNYAGMPRQSRIDTTGALHHIMARGIERSTVFCSDADRDDFLERLGGILQDTHTIWYAWALIPNHARTCR